jgi:hypothetical protein
MKKANVFRIAALLSTIAAMVLGSGAARSWG